MIRGHRVLHPLQRNNRLVWDETQKIMLELFEQVWGTKNQISVDNIVDLTVPVGTCCSIFPC